MRARGTTFSYAIQGHDFWLSDDVTNVSLAQAIQAFHDFDWQRELDAYVWGSGSEDCPIGISYFDSQFFDGGDPKGLLLFIEVTDPEHISIHFHYPKARLAYGIYPVTRWEIHRAFDLKWDRVPEFLRLLFERRTEEILSITG